MGPRWRHVLEPLSGGLIMGPRWRHVLGGLNQGASLWALGGGMSRSLYQGVHYTGTLFLPLF